MASESLCSATLQHQRNPLGSNQRSREDGREIELLKSRVAELERKFDESQNEVRQLMAELEMLQRTIDQRDQQVEPLENEIQLQYVTLFFYLFVCIIKISKFTKHYYPLQGNLFSLRYGGYGGWLPACTYCCTYQIFTTSRLSSHTDNSSPQGKIKKTLLI